MPKFSIIMPVLMQYDYQYRMTTVCIKNIQAFSYNYELIILHSLKEYYGDKIKNSLRKEDQYIPFDNNPSQAQALNIGISKARGEYIILIGNDNFVHQDYLKEIDKKLDDPIFKVLACCVDRLPPDEWKEFCKARKEQNYMQATVFSYINFQGVTIKKSILDELGPLDENLPFYLWERDVNIRFQEKGINCGIVLTSYMTTPQNMTRDNKTLPEGITNWWTDEAKTKEHKYFFKKWGRYA